MSTILSITSEGTNLYAGSYNYGLYVSSDNGATWKKASVNNVNALQFVGSSLYIATANGISVTTDKGNTSKSVSTGLPLESSGRYAFVNCLAVKETSLFAGLFYKGMYRSKDNGATWAPLTNGFPTDSNVSSMLVNGSAIIAGTNNGVFISYDNGDSWSNYSFGLPVNFSIQSLATYGSRIYAGTALGLYYSDNNGSTWQSINIGSKDFENIQSLRVNGSNIYVGGSKSGVIMSKDGGISWATANVGLTNEGIIAMVKKNGSIFAATENCTVYESKDHGASWKTVNKQFSSNPVTSLTAVGDSLLATTNGSGVYFSIDNGVNWASLGNLNSTSPQVYDLIIYKNKITIGNVMGAYQYHPQNDSWVPLGTGLPANPLVIKFFIRKNVLYAGTHAAGLYRSTDEGAIWSKVTLAPNAQTVKTIASSGNYIVVPSNGSMFSSKDNGNTFQAIPGNTVSSEIYTSAAVDSSYVFFGSYEGVFFSTNHGYTIRKCNTGLPEVASVHTLFVDGDKLWAGTSEGVWSVPLSSFYPTVSSFSPTSGPPGTLVTLTATNFDNLPEYNFVTFNGVKAKVISVSSTGLVVEVPNTATKGRITLTVVSKTATTAIDFCISPPKPTITDNGLTTPTPTLTSSSSTGNQWFLNNLLLEGETNQTLNISKDGSYTVQVTANGCSSPPSNGFNIIITEIEEVTDHGLDISFYPVPTRDRVTINLGKSNLDNDVSIQIFDSLGQKMYTYEAKTSAAHSVDVSYYVNGIYIMWIRTGNIFYNGKFLKI